MAYPSHAPRRHPVPLQDREEVLDETLIAMTQQKGRVETRGQTSAVVVFGRRVSHVLHLLLTVFTCGWWGPVWLLLAAFTGERRTTVSVDQYAVASQNRAPMPTSRIILIVLAVLWLALQLLFFGSFVAALTSNQ